MKKSVLKKYAELIVKVGANVQKGQDVQIYVNVDQEELANYVVQYCYKQGANYVTVNWISDKVSNTQYKKASVKALSTIPEWRIEKEKYINKTLPIAIFIESSSPDAMKGVNQAKLAKVNKAVYPVLKPFRDERENKYQWVVVGAASKEWAKKVFPELSPKKAVEKLWEKILETARCTDDPIKAWEEHNADLEKRSKYLSSLDIDYLHYESKNGTNFKVWLMPDVHWTAGGERTQGTRRYFNPNLPTEECFTSPWKGKAEGKVVSTKPLSYNGELIEDFEITFKGGKAVEVKAKKGQELLEHMIAQDEGACMLGEVALVPYDSPINNTGILFYNTLFDENAACHLALGHAFTHLRNNYEKYSYQELVDYGFNDSSIHVDFMIGSKDLNITGYTRDGKKVAIFRDGNWAF